MYRKKYLFFQPENLYDHSDTGFGDKPCEEPDKDGKPDCIRIGPEDLYTQEQGCGFITEKNMEQQPLLMLPEFNGGFLPAPWYRQQELTQIRQERLGCTVCGENVAEDDALKDRQIPLRFKCNVPAEGSYKINVVIRAEEEISDIRIFTGRRCLGAYQEKLLPGEVLCRELLTEVCGIIPRGQEKIYENNCVEVTVTADRPCLSEIEIEALQCPVLYIAGDSTVTDQSAEYPYAPETSYAGWGQMLPYFIRGNLTVSNHSHSGLTTESFRLEGHAEIPMNRCRKGDYMLFQFGHNDQKLMHLKAFEGYRSNLENYITECREKGVYPILATPVARNSWRGNDGKYNDLLKEYAEACLETGRKMSVPVLDLHRLSMELILSLQKEGAKKYFYPSDYTHHNDFGAQKMAAMICREIKRTCGSGDTGYGWLGAQIEDNLVLWPEPSVLEPLKKPENFALEDAECEFEEPDRPLDLLLRAEALDMVIKRAGFFITNVYNDLFTDVIGHEWYAGAVECGLQNGILTGEICESGKFRPLEPVTLLDFTIFLMLAYGSRKNLPKTQSCPYDAVVKDSVQPLVSAAWQLGVLSADGTDLLYGSISRGQGAEICRKLKIM